MKKEEFDAKDKKYKGFFGRGRWSLCIGAGISFGIVPTWFDLTYLVYNRCFNTTHSKDEFEKLVNDSGWSLDSWLQCCQNQYFLEGKSDNDFAELLKEIMYSDLLQRASNYSLKKELIMSFNDPFRLHYSKIIKLCDFYEKEYPNNSTIQLVKFIIQTIDSNKPPCAIISFNADAIFDALLYMFHSKILIERTNEKWLKKRKCNRIIRTVEYGTSNHIPIFHLHGCLFPNEGIIGYQKKSNSVSKLVFDENSYLKIAGSTYNWAQTTFLYHAQFDQLLFVGLSMSDSNIRKWLAWTTENHNNELKETRKKDILNLKHLWLTKKSGIQNINTSLLHLGIRIATIDDWNELNLSLNNILGLK